MIVNVLNLEFKVNRDCIVCLQFILHSTSPPYTVNPEFLEMTVKVFAMSNKIHGKNLRP